MPKVPESEWRQSINPESEEYSPTLEEIGEENRIKESIAYELSNIDHELAHPTKDPYTGEENIFVATDPESFWNRLAYLRIDLLDKIKDPELLNELEVKISRTEQEIYKQFIPFIESRINVFGWQSSPLEKRAPLHKISVEEMQSYFEQARTALKHLKVSEEDHLDFLVELDRLEEKLDRYQGEPTLFTFERIEEELQKELYDIEYYGNFYFRPQKPLKGLEDDDATRKIQTKFELLLAKAHSLVEISSRMLTEQIRTNCEARSESLFEYVEYFKAKSEAPRELLATEAELKDLLQRMNGGEKVESEKLDELERTLLEMKEKKLGLDYKKVVENLKKLFEKTKRVFAGEKIDDDDTRFSAETVGADWAWALLGVEKNSSMDDVRRAYHRLARKYHPDISTQEDAVEKMKRINQAFELIKRVGNYK